MELLGVVWLFGFFGYYYIPAKNRKQFLLLYCVIFALIGFSYQPHTADDLYREYINLSDIQKSGWDYFNSTTINFSTVKNKFEGLYATQLYYYLFAQLPCFNFLPAITLFIEYYLQFSLLDKCSRRYNLSKIESWVLFVFIISTRETYMMMSGIRNQLAFTIFCYFLYMELVEQKKTFVCWFMYFVALFLHQAVSVLLVIRILLFIKNRKIRMILSGMMFVWSIFLNAINNILSHFSQLNYIASLLYKINIYTVNNGGNAHNLILTSRYLLYMIAYAPILILMIVIGISMFKTNTVSSNKYTPLYEFKNLKIIHHKKRTAVDTSFDVTDFLTMVSCFAIGSVSYYWLYLRYAIPVGVIGIVPISQVLKNRMNQKRMWISLVMISCLIKFAIIMLYMNRNMNFDLFGIWR